MILPDFASGWDMLGALVHLAAAAAAVFVAIWLTGRRARMGPAADSLIAALVLSALWALLAGATGGESAASGIAEAVRNLALLLAVYRLFTADGRHASVRQVRPALLAVALVELLLFPTLLVSSGHWSEGTGAALFQTVVVLRLLATIGGLVLVHNLFVGASPQARRALRWPAVAIGLTWLADFNLYTIAYLLARWPAELAALHGFWAIASAVLLAIGGARNRERLRIGPSREAAFQSLSLVAVVGYLLAITAISRGLEQVEGDLARVLQFTFVIGGLVAALLVLPSRRLRGWLRVTATKHLFRHRYDYRAEWLRFAATVGRAEANGPSLEERAIQALAEITESPGGLLLGPDEDGGLTLSARWHWVTAQVPAEALDRVCASKIERSAKILELDEVRSGRDSSHALPPWLAEEKRAWALVPLLHYDRLVGVAVLARPAIARKLDWEDFDVLRVAGRQLASYLAEHAGQQALAEANRFDDFHRRIAFVMHDIKNLASQLGLLARNAERHADNPDFRADMLITLRNSADKLNALLGRLSRYGATAVGDLSAVALQEAVQGAVDQFAGRHPVMIVQTDDCRVRADADSLEQVLLHLIQNAVDASDRGSPVFLRIAADGLNGSVEIVDSGHGMSPEFVRSRLFKPFVSTKPGGFGIGAYEARELVRAMKGRLDVDSHEGLGTRFTIRLPLAAASGLIAGTGQKVA